METCKKLGKEILEASIDELEHFGLPQTSQEENAFYDLIFSSLEDELKGIQVKEIKALLTKLEKKEMLVADVREKLLGYGPNVAATVLANILSDQLFIKELNK
jgi:predicted transcriptional regulator